jgi:translocator assembly and maintenance protein 41
MYHSIITEGFKGFDKLLIPKDFYAPNQEIVVDADQQVQLQDTVLKFTAPISVSIGYGSGVLPQSGYEKDAKNDEEKQIDFIHIVESNEKFHETNVRQFPQHYSVRNLGLIKLIQGDGIYFNPFVRLNSQLIKYGVISRRSSVIDLTEWSSLYFAGRLQKPVNFIKDDDIMIKFLNQYNLKNAMSLSMILLNDLDTFTERQLYEQITSLSYLGDFRMAIGGENPKKVGNIVEKQFSHFKQLYDPILHYFIQRNILIIMENGENRVFKSNLNTNNKIKLISTFPLQFRSQLYQLYREKSIKEIAKDKNLGKNLIKIVSSTIRVSSLKQMIRGVFTAGLFNSIKYAWAKNRKFRATK